MTFFVYILRTSSNTLYTGQTNNLKKRIKEHRQKSSKASKYVRSFPSFKLAYWEKQPNKHEAMKREAEIKKWPKKEKEILVSSKPLNSSI